MTDTVQGLTSEQAADLRRQLREHGMQVLTGNGTGALPPCPACGAEAERLQSQAEGQVFEVDERVIRYRWLPCGHQFRAAVDLDEELVRPGGEPTT